MVRKMIVCIMYNNKALVPQSCRVSGIDLELRLMSLWSFANPRRSPWASWGTPHPTSPYPSTSQPLKSKMSYWSITTTAEWNIWHLNSRKESKTYVFIHTKPNFTGQLNTRTRDNEWSQCCSLGALWSLHGTRMLCLFPTWLRGRSRCRGVWL